MLKTPIDISQFKDNTVQADIQYLKEFLDERDSWENPTMYKVLEYFPPEDNPLDYTPTVYGITNLVITDIEDDTVIFDGYLEDKDISLFNNFIENDVNTNLNVFLISNIIMIGINKGLITISFDSGYIQLLY